METAEGTVLIVQEGRLRLLREDGRALALALSPAAPIEAQDLPALLHRRVRVGFKPVPGMHEGAIHRIERL